MSERRVARAIDIGYGHTKFVIDDQHTCRMFPSVAARAEAQRARSSALRERRTSEVRVKGERYEVGPDAALFFAHVPVLHRDYIETPEYLALVYGALDAMRLARIDLLVTGLPVHLHESRWMRLRELLIGTHILRPDVSVEIREAAVVVQPVGGLVAHSHERGDWAEVHNRTRLIPDLGYFSFDWVVTKGLTEVPGLSGSAECGMAQYLKAIAERLSALVGEPYTHLRAIDEGLRTRHFRVNGRLIDLAPYAAQAQEAIAPAIRALRNNIGAASQNIDEIVLVGGGAPYLLPSLREAFPSHTIRLVPESVTANVRGFQLIGETYLQRRSVA
jgi:plasmid segregation protein ParM